MHRLFQGATVLAGMGVGFLAGEALAPEHRVSAGGDAYSAIAQFHLQKLVDVLPAVTASGGAVLGGLLTVALVQRVETTNQQ